MHWQTAEEMLLLGDIPTMKEFGDLQLEARASRLTAAVDKILAQWARTVLQQVTDFDRFCVYKGSVSALLTLEHYLLGEVKKEYDKRKADWEKHESELGI